MERLQAALEKARASRGTPRHAAEPAPRRRRGAPSPETWEALPRIELSEPKLVRNRIVTSSGGGNATHFDLLRTKMLQQMRTHRWKRVAITSPGGACGKTTIAANLAASLMRHSELSVIVLDLDLRRPSMARILGLSGERSCWEVLAGEVPFEEQAVRIGDSVALSLNHKAARNPAELLASGRAAEVIDAIEERYRPDVMLFDMPPMLLTDDNVAFMRNVHCAILVAGAESTTTSQIDVCERDLAEQTNVMGVVLNKCRYMTGDQSYDYY
jgi:Mrp family chromosome partitioning ATPase